MTPSVYFVLMFNKTFNPTNNLSRLDALEEVITDLYHTFVFQDDDELPLIEAIEKFFALPKTLETVKQELYFE